MAQSDLTIQNQSFPSFRSDLNDALTALNTTQSGTSRPSSAVAGTIWLDTTNATSPTLKLYDGGDDISLATLDYSANTVNWLDSTVSADLVNDLSPQLGGMLDVNGQAIGNGTEELIKFSETASAVNEVTVTNSATGNAPEISATGDDTNIDFKLTPKGTGKLVLDGLNFPTADGTTGQFLKTDGSGNLSFDDAGGGKVLQVVSTAFTSANTSTTSTTDVAISGFSASITPSSASNKVLILVNANGLNSVATYGELKVYKNGSELIKIAGQFSYDGSVTGEDNSCATVSYLDSPSTTSSTTYAMYWLSGNGNSVIINANGSTSTITLMEIAG